MNSSFLSITGTPAGSPRPSTGSSHRSRKMPQILRRAEANPRSVSSRNNDTIIRSMDNDLGLHDKKVLFFEKLEQHAGQGKLASFQFIHNKGNGNTIKFPEFVMACNEFNLAGSIPDMTDLFNEFDAEGRGEIDFETFSKINTSSDAPFLRSGTPSEVPAASPKEDRTAVMEFNRVSCVLRKHIEHRVSSSDGLHHAYLHLHHGPGNQITWDEFKNVIHELELGMTDEEILPLFHHYDSTHTGGISYQEFVDNVMKAAPTQNDTFMAAGPRRSELTVHGNGRKHISTRLNDSSMAHLMVEGNARDVRGGLVSATDGAAQLNTLLCKRYKSMLSAFRSIDVCNSGKITEAELRHAMDMLHLPMTDSDFHSFFDAINVSHDGKISYKQFEEYFASNLSRSSSNNAVTTSVSPRGVTTPGRPRAPPPQAATLASDVPAVSPVRSPMIRENSLLDGINSLLRKLRPKWRSVQSALVKTDRGRNGFVTPHDFLRVMVGLSIPLADSEIQALTAKYSTPQGQIKFVDVLRAAAKCRPRTAAATPRQSPKISPTRVVAAAVPMSARSTFSDTDTELIDWGGFLHDIKTEHSGRRERALPEKAARVCQRLKPQLRKHFREVRNSLKSQEAERGLVAMRTFRKTLDVHGMSINEADFYTLVQALCKFDSHQVSSSHHRWPTQFGNSTSLLVNYNKFLSAALK